MELLDLAKNMIGWQHSLRSLLKLRPPWILTSSRRCLVGCLCELCHNITLHLRALQRGLGDVRRTGGAPSLALAEMQLPSTVGELLDQVLHPKDGRTLNMLQCYEQRCSGCGKSFFHQLMKSFVEVAGERKVELLQHVKVFRHAEKDGRQVHSQCNQVARIDRGAPGYSGI